MVFFIDSSVNKTYSNITSFFRRCDRGVEGNLVAWSWVNNPGCTYKENNKYHREHIQQQFDINDNMWTLSISLSRLPLISNPMSNTSLNLKLSQSQTFSISNFLNLELSQSQTYSISNLLNLELLQYIEKFLKSFSRVLLKLELYRKQTIFML